MLSRLAGAEGSGAGGDGTAPTVPRADVSRAEVQG
jgi:hypothetical protein